MNTLKRSTFALMLLFAIQSCAYAQDDRAVSWGQLIPNIVADQQRVWTFPVRLAHGQNLMPTLAVLGTTGGLLTLDPIEAGYFKRTTAFQNFNNTFSGNRTTLGTLLFPLSLYGVGLVRADSRMQQTALLAGEAVADVEVPTTFLKGATARSRPSSIGETGNLYDTWFDSGSVFRANGSFPSGHTVAAFAVATVVARRYGNHRWIPYAAYGTAALVGFSRLTLSAHYSSDVFMGAAMGYTITRFTVLNPK